MIPRWPCVCAGRGTDSISRFLPVNSCHCSRSTPQMRAIVPAAVYTQQITSSICPINESLRSLICTDAGGCGNRRCCCCFKQQLLITCDVSSGIIGSHSKLLQIETIAAGESYRTSFFCNARLAYGWNSFWSFHICRQTKQYTIVITFLSALPFIFTGNIRLWYWP